MTGHPDIRRTDRLYGIIVFISWFAALTSITLISYASHIRHNLVYLMAEDMHVPEAGYIRRVLEGGHIVYNGF